MSTVWEELQRICLLPTMQEPSDEWVEAYSRAVCPPSAWLLPEFEGLLKGQAWCLATYREQDHLFAIVPAGKGKTVIAYGCAEIAFKEKGHRRILMLTSNSVYDQFSTKGAREARDYLGVDLPYVRLGGCNANARMTRVQAVQEGVFIMPYSLLSQPDAEKLLQAIMPTCVIADEAHKLRNIKTAAGTKRFFRVIDFVQDQWQGHPPTCIFMSGTMTNKGLTDFWHLCKYGLREMSPLPLTYHTANELSSGLNTEAGYHTPVENDRRRLIDWNNVMFPTDKQRHNYIGLRKSCSKRIATAPGVVRIDGELCDATLQMTFHDDRNEWVNPKMNSSRRELEWSEEIQLASHELVDTKGDPLKYSQPQALMMHDVDQADTAPNGDEIEYGLHKYKWLKELTAGFYNDTYWDEQRWEPKALAQAKQHHARKQIYHAQLRQYLEERPQMSLDTPMNAARYMINQGEIPGEPELYEYFCDMKALEWEGMPTRSTRPVWVDDTRMSNVMAWCRKQRRRAIIWTDNIEFHKELVRRLAMEQASFIDLPSGNQKKIPSWPTRPGQDGFDKAQFWVMAAPGYTEGLNLQWADIQCFAQWIRNASAIEQNIARQHRTGQPSDEVNLHAFRETYFDDLMISATLNGSAYIQQQQGTPQRLMVADYNPQPEMVSDAFLADRVPKVQTLSPEARAAFERKFQTS